ncbi:bifunctional metallophosphatase/5'-nucleotidase [Uliginosibacterium sp. H3]|uniref:Bifunctional metallophosphatase/5'-nucleotidase n=1 Tax=Uliginosibacterium silvisoli TaxID=3114758 RepID=A0ABU6K5R5_9RHOO|nr:bifunctional metallophosphatase/5'-nucleotidase [Uliginosibacterium sp. H3]
MKLHHAILACALGAASVACSAAPVSFKIVSFNDFHGNLQSPGTFRPNSTSAAVAVGGIDYMAAYVAAAKAANPNTVVVSAGDIIGASPLISAFFHDEGTIETMNRLGLDFNAVGNHEFDDGKTELLRMQNGGCHPTDAANSCKGATVGTPVPFEGAKFKFLSANVVDTASGKPLFAPYGIKQFGNVRVGFIGLTLAETPSIVTPSGVAGLSFKDEVATINALVPQLRARGVETIVVLIHQGGFQDTTANPSITDINGCTSANGSNQLDASDSSAHFKDIVSKLDDAVDLVISGHTHAPYNCQLPNKIGRKIPVTSASAFGRVVTEIDVTVESTNNQLVSINAVNKLVDRTNLAITPDATIQGIVNGYSSLVAPLAGAVIGTITAPLSNGVDASGNMPAGALIADSQYLATQPADFGGAEVAFMNPGGVRNPGFTAAPFPHDVTYGEAFTVQPFGNSLVTVTLTNQNLKDVLEQQFSGCMGQTTQKILLPSAQLKYQWDSTLPLCGKVKNVVLNGETLVDACGVVQSPTATHRVTINNFLSTGGDGFTVFKSGTNLLGGAQDIDALIAYLLAFKSPNAAYDQTVPALALPRVTKVSTGACSAP